MLGAATAVAGNGAVAVTDPRGATLNVASTSSSGRSSASRQRLVACNREAVAPADTGGVRRPGSARGASTIRVPDALGAIADWSYRLVVSDKALRRRASQQLREKFPPKSLASQLVLLHLRHGVTMARRRTVCVHELLISGYMGSGIPIAPGTLRHTPRRPFSKRQSRASGSAKPRIRVSRKAGLPKEGAFGP